MTAAAVACEKMLVLASKSPRRQEILRNAGFQFVVRPVDLAEMRLPGESPESYVLRLAKEKAQAAAASPQEIVLGADTVVVIADEILEKPASREDAARMLRLLSGAQHEVLTGICLHRPGRTVADLARTAVRFCTLSEDEIQEYVASGEPMDKAGAYAIQGLASKFIERVEGCYFNVVGLPVSLFYAHWKTFVPACGLSAGSGQQSP